MASGKRVARRLGAWLCFSDESGYALRPARARTWAPQGATPVVTVAGKGGRKLSVAGLVCYHPEHESRFVFRTMVHRGRVGEPKGFGEVHLISLLDKAHQQLGGPVVLVWDGLPAHRSARMRRLIAARPWLRVFQLPAYAPELNPTENVWSNLRRGLSNLMAGPVTALTAAVKKRLRRVQNQSGLIDGFLAATGLRPP